MTKQQQLPTVDEILSDLKKAIWERAKVLRERWHVQRGSERVNLMSSETYHEYNAVQSLADKACKAMDAHALALKAEEERRQAAQDRAES